MLKTLFKSPTALFYAIVVHAVLIGILVFSMDWSTLKENKPEEIIVDAVAVDEKKILKQIENLKKKERQKKKKEDRRQKKLKDEALKAKRDRLREEQELAKLKKLRAEQAKKHKDAQKSLAKTKKRLDDTKKKHLAEQKRRQELIKNRKLAEKKLAKVRQEKQRLDEQAAREKELKRQRRIEELERKIKQEDKRHRMDEMAAEVDERNKQIEAESNRLSEQRQKQIQSVTAKYTALIKEKIKRSWRVPASAKIGTKSTVSVRLIPGGEVIMVATIKSSGDAFFDSSVETAVYRAVPLPLPKDPDMFEYFRELNLVLRKEE